MIDPPPETEPILQGKGEELKDLYLGSVASDHMVGLALVGALATGLGVMARRPAPEYALALAWAFVGIAAANLPAAAALAGLSALAAAVLLWRGWQAMEKGAGT